MALRAIFAWPASAGWCCASHPCDAARGWRDECSPAASYGCAQRASRSRMAALSQPLGRRPPAGAARRMHATLHGGGATSALPQPRMAALSEPPAAGWLRSASRLAGVRRLVLRVASMRRCTGVARRLSRSLVWLRSVNLPQPDGCAQPAAWPASAGWCCASHPCDAARGRRDGSPAASYGCAQSAAWPASAGWCCASHPCVAYNRRHAPR